MNARPTSLAALAALALGACTTTPQPGEAATEVREVTFTCAHGETLSVRFFPKQGVAVLVRNGENIELDQKVSGSGFIYSNGPNTIRGKGDDLTVEIGRMVPLQWKAQRG